MGDFDAPILPPFRVHSAHYRKGCTKKFPGDTILPLQKTLPNLYSNLIPKKSEIDLKQLNSSITTDVKNLDTGFDLIFALLAFHHLKTPETMLNQVLKDNYLNPGGRILIMDYERDPKKQIFHPIHLINGEHYEHDGFTEKIVRDWFEKGK